MLTECRHDIAEMELAELEQALETLGRPRFHGRQLFQWIHKRGITDFGEMTDLGRDLRATLAAEFRIVTRARHAAHALQYRADGDGRTAPQLRRDDESAAYPRGRARTVGESTSYHAL